LDAHAYSIIRKRVENDGFHARSGLPRVAIRTATQKEGKAQDKEKNKEKCAEIAFRIYLTQGFKPIPCVQVDMKIENLKKQLNKLGIETMFVSGPKSIQYLSGYQCRSYKLTQKIDDPEVFLLITPDKNFVLADARHAGVVEKLDGFEFAQLPYPTNPQTLGKLITKLIVGANTLGFEENSFLFKDLKELKKELEIKTLDASGIIEKLRVIKESDEIKKLEKASEVTSAGFEFALEQLRQGMTEKGLAFEITSFFLKNADGNSFPPIVAFEKGSAVPHYESVDKKIEGQGILLIDLGCMLEGFAGDMTRTVYVGKAPEKFKKRYQAVLDAQKNCLQNVRSGMTGKDADLLARNALPNDLKEAFSHGTGHGLGLDIHEDPRIRSENNTALEDGMVFTVEPGIYLPEWGGIRIEDVVYLKNGKPVNITKTPKDLLQVSSK